MEKIKAFIGYSSENDALVYRTFTIIDKLYSIGDIVANLRVDEIYPKKINSIQDDNNTRLYTYYTVVLHDADGWTDNDFIEYIAVKKATYSFSDALRREIEYNTQLIKSYKWGINVIKSKIIDYVKTPPYVSHLTNSYGIYSDSNIADFKDCMINYFEMIYHALENHELDYENL
jgi:hypothetical protein